MNSLLEVMNNYYGCAGPCLVKGKREKYTSPTFHAFYSTQQTKPKIVINSLDYLMKQRVISTNPEHNLNFLDMGTFRGILPITIAGVYDFIDAYGIEARPGAVALANEVIKGMKTNGFFGNNKCEVHLGNFFPDNFEVSKEAKWGALRKIPEYLLDSKPYKSIGLGINDFDILFFYQFLGNTDETLQLLSKRSKQGAVVMTSGKLNDKTIPSNLELVLKNQDISAFRKK